MRHRARQKESAARARRPPRVRVPFFCFERHRVLNTHLRLQHLQQRAVRPGQPRPQLGRVHAGGAGERGVDRVRESARVVHAKKGKRVCGFFRACFCAACVLRLCGPRTHAGVAGAETRKRRPFAFFFFSVWSSMRKHNRFFFFFVQRACFPPTSTPPWPPRRTRTACSAW